MKPAEIADRLTLAQKFALVLASANERRPIRGKLWYQKEMFVLATALPDLADELGYEPSLKGAMSDTLQWHVDQLEAIGLIEQQQEGFLVSDRGSECALWVQSELDSDVLKRVEEIKSLLNDVPKDELLAFVYYMFPDTTVESEELPAIEGRRKELAVRLFAKGKVGLEKGAMVAGMSVPEFSAFLNRKGVSRYAE